MGEATRKKRLGLGPDPIPGILKNTADAVARYMDAAGVMGRGSDCELHAKLLHASLTERGIPARIAVGYAMWRVGSDAAACIGHHPAICTTGGSFHGHFWVRSGRYIVDATPWQWQMKLDLLQQMDGRHARLEWPAASIVMDASGTKPRSKVINGRSYGAYYEEAESLKPHLDLLNQSPIDELNYREFKFALNNPDAICIGLGNSDQMAKSLLDQLENQL